ncbi:MAG: hypothetical protein JXJ19_08590 [Elusimicrobia bacterium]|nr:hypothetical protein [Elusimicrobiota bacterium]
MVYWIGTSGYDTGSDIKMSGTLGIGTEIPCTKLHLYNEGGALMRFEDGDGGSKWDIGAYDDTGLEFSEVNGGSTLRMIIMQGGTVGIGTSNPGGRQLMVKVAANSTGIFYGKNSSDDEIILTAADSGGNGVLALGNSAGNIRVNISANSSTDTYFNAGDVGIGTTSPGDKLDVNGDIVASGCISDGTCESFNSEDAVKIIEDINSNCLDEKDEYGHPRQDLKYIHSKYPFMIKETSPDGEKKYYDKLGAKSDLCYSAILQLHKRIEELEAKLKEINKQ